MYYVTMTDKFMSGWGPAKDKINKLVFECETYEEAEIVESKAQDRSEMKNININSRKPSYSADRYYTSWKNKEDAAAWYRK